MNPSTTNLGEMRDIDVIDKHISVKDQFLIDAGCGDMGLSRALAKRGAHVLAIDPDPVQAEKNRAAPITANVGFAETGADNIPVVNNSIDGVLFPYSMHHIPAEKLDDVFTELQRILKPTGFVYIMEPVASGALNDVIRLFHDESKVRAEVQQYLDLQAPAVFDQIQVINYHYNVEHSSWDDFCNSYAGKSYNTNAYTAEDVQRPAVKEKFEQLATQHNHFFDCPIKVTLLSGKNINVL